MKGIRIVILAKFAPAVQGFLTEEPPAEDIANNLILKQLNELSKDVQYEVVDAKYVDIPEEVEP